MKLLTGIRYALAGVLVFGTIPLLVLASCMDVTNPPDVLSWWKELILIAVYFTLSWYEGRLRKQRGLPDFYDQFNIMGLSMLKWICLGAALFAAFWLFSGIDSFTMQSYVGQEIHGMYVTEGDAESFFFYGLFVTYPSTVVLSALLPLFAGASIHLYKRKRLLRMSGPDA